MNDKKKLAFAGAGVIGALAVLTIYMMTGGAADPSVPTAQVEAGATPVLRASEEPMIDELPQHGGYSHP